MNLKLYDYLTLPVLLDMFLIYVLEIKDMCLERGVKQ